MMDESLPTSPQAEPPGRTALGVVLTIEVALGFLIMILCGAVGFFIALEADYHNAIFLGFALLGVVCLVAPMVAGAIWYPERPALAILVGGAPNALALIWIALSVCGLVPYR